MIEIDKGIAPPAIKRGPPSKYPFADMQPGDSFPVEQKLRMSVWQCARGWVSTRNLDWKFSVRLDENGQLRCWRVS
ncbi:hypothetical protein UFOVP868_7 [uncultured Caudovirales phage]|uniref:Uncharacterized protein n=1 Tax=uncultured Caudovirales phage TaxID=2100421 RepID=A0A6J5P6S5_9CAUD|nr:hypothetical protein UFOVP868_7 [uncultured Caudovirales phage]